MSSRERKREKEVNEKNTQQRARDHNNNKKKTTCSTAASSRRMRGKAMGTFGYLSLGLPPACLRQCLKPMYGASVSITSASRGTTPSEGDSGDSGRLALEYGELDEGPYSRHSANIRVVRVIRVIRVITFTQRSPQFLHGRLVAKDVA